MPEGGQAYPDKCCKIQNQIRTAAVNPGLKLAV